MLSKRIFWLTCAAAIASWLIWVRLRQRQDEFAASTPQFAPPRTFTPPPPAAPPASLPNRDEAPAATAAPEPPATAIAPASAESAAEVAEADEADEAPATTAAPEPPATDIAPASAESAAEVADAAGSAEAEISGYCMRCKTKRPIQHAHRETTESGRPAARGTCPICGANMFTFLATDDDNA